MRGISEVIDADTGDQAESRERLPVGFEIEGRFRDPGFGREGDAGAQRIGLPAADRVASRRKIGRSRHLILGVADAGIQADAEAQGFVEFQAKLVAQGDDRCPRFKTELAAAIDFGLCETDLKEGFMFEKVGDLEGPAEVEAVKGCVEEEITSDIRPSDRFIAQEGEFVARTKVHEREFVSGVELPIDLELKVVVARGDREIKVAVFREDQVQEGIEVAASEGGDEGRAFPQRAFEEAASVDEVEFQVAVKAIGAFAGLEMDHPSGSASEGDGKAAGDEVELAGGVAIDDGGQAAEVVELRDLMAVEVGTRVAGGGTSNDEEARIQGGTSHAGEVLNDLERVALGSGGQADLFLLEGLTIDFHRVTAFAGDAFKRTDPGAAQVHGDRELLFGSDLDDGLELVVVGDGDDKAILARREAADREETMFVGDLLSLFLSEEIDGRAFDGLSCTAFEDVALDDRL